MPVSPGPLFVRYCLATATVVFVFSETMCVRRLITADVSQCSPRWCCCGPALLPPIIGSHHIASMLTERRKKTTIFVSLRKSVLCSSLCEVMQQCLRRLLFSARVRAKDQRQPQKSGSRDTSLLLEMPNKSLEPVSLVCTGEMVYRLLLGDRPMSRVGRRQRQAEGAAAKLNNLINCHGKYLLELFGIFPHISKSREKMQKHKAWWLGSCRDRSARPRPQSPHQKRRQVQELAEQDLQAI